MVQRVEYQWDRNLSFAYRDSEGDLRTIGFDARVVVESPLIASEYIERAFASVDSVLDKFDEALILYHHDSIWDLPFFMPQMIAGKQGRFIVVPYWPEPVMVATHLLWELRRECPAPTSIRRLHFSGLVLESPPTVRCDFAEAVFSKDDDAEGPWWRKKSNSDSYTVSATDPVAFSYTTDRNDPPKCENCSDCDCGL